METDYTEALRNAQPSWAKDGLGIRGDAPTTVNKSNQTVQRDQDIYTGKVVREEIPAS